MTKAGERLRRFRRRWWTFRQWWCGGLRYWLFYPYETAGKHRWVNDGPYKRTCSRCGLHEWVMSRPYPRLGEPESYWHMMNLGEPPRRAPPPRNGG